MISEELIIKASCICAKYYSDSVERMSPLEARPMVTHLLAELTKDMPRVYGNVSAVHGPRDFGYCTQGHAKIIGDTHTAILFDMQEIQKKECEHVPFRISCAEEFGGTGQVKIDGFKPICGKCGKKLKAKWELAE